MKAQIARILSTILIFFAIQAEASPQWTAECAAVKNSAEWCGFIYNTISSMIMVAQESGHKFNLPYVKVTFEHWSPTGGGNGTPKGILSFSDGLTRCSQPMTGYAATSPLECR